MRQLEALTCGSCGAPVSPGAAACSWCQAARPPRSPLVLDALTPDERWDLRAAEPPGLWPAHEAVVTPDGRAFPLPADVVRWATVPGPMRHGVVGLRARCTEDAGGFGLLARVSTTGGIRSAYALTLRPDSRSFRLGRLIQDDRSHMAHDVLLDWTTTAAVAPLGEWTTAELRFVEGLLEVWLDGQAVARVADEAFGFGQVGWRVGAWDGPATVEVAEVWRGGLR